MNPDEIRTAQIQRQHSQEMALRLVHTIVSRLPAKEVPSFEQAWGFVVGLTDDFERDIKNAVAFREARKDVNKDVKSNGNPTEVVIDDIQAKKIVTVIKETDTALHPMIKNKMTSMGIKGINNLERAVKQLTPEKAEDLRDYIVSLDLPA
jgi:hypothetical protein